MARQYSRRLRVNHLLREEIAHLLQRDVKDVRVERVTVGDVEVTSDLKHASVYVQVGGDEANQQAAVQGLKSAAGFIRSRLGRELHIRRIPELHFILDRTQERAARINRLLQQVRESDGGTGGDGDGSGD